MKAITELDLDNPTEVKALKTVLQKIVAGKIIVTVKQMIDDGNEIKSNDIQTAVAETGTMIYLKDNLAYITVRNLKRSNVKQLQNLWKTVLQRGTLQFQKGEACDYYMTTDCIYIDEYRHKSYLFGCFSTPLFCSSDGDEDLMMVVPINDCFISIDRYSEQEADYEAMKQVERGKTVSPLLQEDYDSPEDEDEN